MSGPAVVCKFVIRQSTVGSPLDKSMRWFWIDRFIEFEAARAKAIKNISLGEEHLHDHFPGYPVMPNTLIVEGMAQTGGLLVCEHLPLQRAGRAGQDLQAVVSLRSACRATP